MTDSTIADKYADEMDDLTEKEILLGILGELGHIRMLLQGEREPSEDSSTEWECARCGKVVDHDQRASHASGSHNATMEMVSGMFEAK